jgi:serine/threonine protein phosphatase PrpC
MMDSFVAAQLPPQGFAGAVTDKGPNRRFNEDAVLLPGMILGGSARQSWTAPLEQPANLVAVFDGMGGHGNGRLAAVTACTFLLDKVASGGCGSEGWLELALQQMADYVTDVGALTQATSRMGATVAGLVVQQSTVSVFSVGDARVYVVDDGYLSLMTDDQRLDDGSPVVTQSIGGSGRREHIEFKHIKLERDRSRRFLVCSDGLSDTLDFAVIAEAVTSGHPLDACTRLVNAAVDADSSDNVTVLVVDA